MKLFLQSLGMAGALAAASLSFTQSAHARDQWDRGGRDNGAAIAIGAGILGLALGAAIADRNDHRYYDRRYYANRRYVTVRDHPGYYYYYDGYPDRYYQDRYYGRPYFYGHPGTYWNRGQVRGFANNRWDRGYNRGFAYNRWDRRSGWEPKRRP